MRRVALFLCLTVIAAAGVAPLDAVTMTSPIATPEPFISPIGTPMPTAIILQTFSAH